MPGRRSVPAAAIFPPRSRLAGALRRLEGAIARARGPRPADVIPIERGTRRGRALAWVRSMQPVPFPVLLAQLGSELVNTLIRERRLQPVEGGAFVSVMDRTRAPG